MFKKIEGRQFNVYIAVHPITLFRSLRAALGTRIIICVSAFPLMCMARLLINDLFSLYVASRQQYITLRVFVFASILLLVTITLLSGAKKIRLISHMNSILGYLSDVTY